MPNLLNKILAGLAFVAALFGLYQRNRADRADDEAQHQSSRADSAQANSDTHQRVNKARDSVQQKHIKEQVDAEQRLENGHRDHFDNNG